MDRNTDSGRQPRHRVEHDDRLCHTPRCFTTPIEPLPHRTPTITYPLDVRVIGRTEREFQDAIRKCGSCSQRCCSLRSRGRSTSPSEHSRKHQQRAGIIFTLSKQSSWGLLLAILLMVLAAPAMGVGDDTSEVRVEGVVPTPVPENYFSEQPANASVPEGDIAVMKCKARMPVYHCRWYYIEMDKDIFQHSSQSKLVKDFKPSNDFDCSIRFTKVRKVQEGQWLCQARQFMKQTVFNTQPAFLEVVSASDEHEYEERRREQGEGDDGKPPSSSEEASIGPHATPIPSDDRTPSSPPPLSVPAPPPRNRGKDHPLTAPRDWDPTAPTAIPALGPPLHSGPLPPPGEGPPGLPPQQPPGAGSADDRDVRPQFSTSFDEHIQNTRTGGSALLPCHVDRPVFSCAWVMPNNALFVWDDAESSVGRSLSINTPVGVLGPTPPPEYEFVGNRAMGNCSLRLHDVTRHDEGNWRCVVAVHSPRPSLHPSLAGHGPIPTVEAKGPLIHLHLLDYPHHYPDYQKPATSPGTNIGLIILFLVGLILFVVGSIVIYCCYKKVWSRATENSKMLNSSTRSDGETDYAQQWFQGRNLKIVDPNYTDDFKLRNVSPSEYKLRNIEAGNMKNAQVKYSDLDHYNQYLSMSQGCGPDSVRSSASSNTTLTTVVPDPLGRGRSVSFGTPAPSMSPTSPTHMGHHNHHPSQHFAQGGMMMSPNGSIISQSPQADLENIPFYELHGKLQRPVSLYSTGHVYEEIQEKIPYGAIGQQHVMNSQGILVPVQGIQCGPIVTTPVYTNVVEDHDGYLIPNKSNKIVNTPTGEDDPAQYLPMRGNLSEAEQKMLSEMQQQPQQHSHGVLFHGGMNNLSGEKFKPTTHVQILDSDAQQKATQARRRSNDSQLSVEQNSSVCDDNGGPEVATSTPTKEATRNPNINSNSPTKQQTHKSASTTPNSKRQKMPLPSQPKTPSSSPTKTQNPQQQTPSKAQPEGSSLHQRTTSLPDSAMGSKISHAKSPSLVPTPENYDVPRSLGAVPRSVNGSEISLDDIDGTIV